ncbi:hypothetical protein GOBAR_DD32022 [Gossypium barbadense]|nr:hypothetical protein GOBAR_DD32022 [Gossypium barbadense]
MDLLNPENPFPPSKPLRVKRPNDYKKDDGTEGKSNGDKSRSTEIEPLTLDDIDHGDALKSFIEGYRDALKSFMEGYQEVIQQIMEKKEYFSTAQQEGNTDKNST